MKKDTHFHIFPIIFMLPAVGFQFSGGGGLCVLSFSMEAIAEPRRSWRWIHRNIQLEAMVSMRMAQWLCLAIGLQNVHLFNGWLPSLPSQVGRMYVCLWWWWQGGHATDFSKVTTQLDQAAQTLHDKNKDTGVCKLYTMSSYIKIHIKEHTVHIYIYI